MENELNLQYDFPRETEPHNVLPMEGEGIYHGVIFDAERSSAYRNYLLDEIPWRNDEAVIFGRHIITARKVAWYGDRNFAYTYSGRTRVALEWTPQLLEIKAAVERLANFTYNSCLLNLYENGDQGMGWHHDDEKGLGKNSNIASVSFGAIRRFDFRHKKSREKVSVMLEHGSMLIMKGVTQNCWQHQIPKTKKVTTPRVNLTFRRMIESVT